MASPKIFALEKNSDTAASKRWRFLPFPLSVEAGSGPSAAGSGHKSFYDTDPIPFYGFAVKSHNCE